MKFHHKVQPHHHVTIWAVTALLVVLAAAMSANTALVSAEKHENGSYSEPGPTERTQEFFGGKVKKQTGSVPESCKKQVNQQDQPTPQSSDQYGGRPTISKEEFDKLSEEEKKRLTKQNVVIVEGTTTPGGYSSARPEGEGQISNENPECQKDMVAQIQNEMREFYDKMKNGTFTKPLDNMLAVVKKLQNGGLETLKQSGVNTAELEKLLPLITQDAQTLKTFFSDMVSVMDKFFSLKDDPEAAFKYMQEGFPHSKMSEMGKVADRLVANIDKLQKELDKITAELDKKTAEGQHEQ